MNPSFFIISGAVAVSGVLLASAWAAYGLPELLSVTAGLAELCQTLFVRCIESSKLGVIILPWIGAILTASGLLNALTKAGIDLYRISMAARILQKMPKIQTSSATIVAIKDDVPAAFTFGLINPKIFLSSGLLGLLGRSELLAVFYHELHHKKNLDPLRLFIVRFITNAFYYIPAIGVYARTFAAKNEFNADAHAADKINDPLSLASAIAKVGKNNAINLAIAGISGDPTSLRIKRLINEEGAISAQTNYKLRTILASALSTLFIAASLILPLTSSSYAKETCTTEHCEIHKDKIGQSCRTHCETHKHAVHNGHMHR